MIANGLVDLTTGSVVFGEGVDSTRQKYAVSLGLERSTMHGPTASPVSFLEIRVGDPASPTAVYHIYDRGTIEISGSGVPHSHSLWPASDFDDINVHYSSADAEFISETVQAHKDKIVPALRAARQSRQETVQARKDEIVPALRGAKWSRQDLVTADGFLQRAFSLDGLDLAGQVLGPAGSIDLR